MTVPTLYSAPLLACAARAREYPLHGAPGATASARSPMCGDDIVIGVVVAEDDRIAEVGIAVEACAVCAASAAIMADEVVGKPVDTVGARMAALDAMLHGVGGEDDGESTDTRFEVLSPVSAFPNRRACALLPWRALENALVTLRSPGAATRGQVSAALAAADTDSLPEVSAPIGDDWLSALRIARDLQAAGEAVAIATLISVVGSSPCPIGSRMVIPVSGDFTGSVSGGCVESAVVQQAIEMLQDPVRTDGSDCGGHDGLVRGRIFDYRISNSAAADPANTCGGEIRVHLQQAPGVDEIDRQVEQLVAGPMLRLSNLSVGSSELIAAGDASTLPAALQPAATAALGDLGARAVPQEAGEVFVEAVQNPPRLVIVGGTHIAQKLARMAPAVGLEPVVVDPREGFANARRFADATFVVDAPARALPGLIDARTAVVTLTHKAEFDDPALEVALATNAFYVGALGSRKTQAARLRRLQDRGLTASQLARLHGPAGVPIGGQGAGEIALSILAEVVAARRDQQRSAGPGRRIATRELRVGAVVLAAGRSQRAGAENKLLHPVDGEPMVVRVVRAVVDAGLQPVLVVVGHEADRVRDALSELPVEFVVNEHFADGIGTSIAAGARSMASRGVSASLMVLGDMPFLRSSDVARLAAVHDFSTRELIVVPEATTATGDKRIGNPVLWPRRYFAELSELAGDTGGKPILQAHLAAAIRVPIDHHGVLRDIDQPADAAMPDQR